MNNTQEEYANEVKQSFETILGADLTLRKKRKTEIDFQKEEFEKLIQSLEFVNTRSILIESDWKIGFGQYDESFYELIDKLITLHFGKQEADIIFFFVYERINADGTINELRDSDGHYVPMNNYADLWNLIQYIRKTKKKIEKVTKKKDAES